MSPRSSSALQTPPAVMTWGKAFLPVCTAGIFDFFGFIFSLFGIFGPLFAGIAANVATSNFVGDSAVGEAVSTGAGAVATVVTGIFASGGLQMFGTIVAMAIGFLGWMVVGFIMLASNRRIFKGTNALVFGSVLLVDELPFINVLPALSYRTIKMYRAQIKADKKALVAYEAAQKQWLRRQQQEISGRNEQLAEQQAANDAIFEQEVEQEEMDEVAEQEALAAQEAANDAIHEQEKLAA